MFTFSKFSTITAEFLEQQKLIEADTPKALQSFETLQLHSDVLNLSGGVLNQYLALVIASGLQVAEYLDKYPREFKEIYKSSIQHSDTQKIILAGYPDLIFDTKITVSDKIDFLSKNFFLFLEAPPFAEEVECLHHLKQQLIQSDVQEIFYFFLRKPYLLQIMHDNHPIEFAKILSLDMQYSGRKNDEDNRANLAQILFLQDCNINLIKHYKDLLVEDVVAGDDLLITYDVFLIREESYMQIIALGADGVSVPTFATAVLRAKQIEKCPDLKEAHIKCLLKFPKVQKSEQLMIFLEKKQLELLNFTTRRAEKFKI